MLQQLRDQFEMFGPVHRFIPIKSFARVLVVYEETLHAMTAKSFMDRMVIRWSEETEDESTEEFVIRVYFGEVFNIQYSEFIFTLYVFTGKADRLGSIIHHS